MADGYGRHFERMYGGSMVGSGGTVFAVWGYVIAKQRDGHVELNPTILSAIIGDPEPQIVAALEHLCAPDPRSRNPAEEGRRLVQEGPFDYRVVSWPVYKRLFSADAEREYDRERKRAQRELDRTEPDATGHDRTEPDATGRYPECPSSSASASASASSTSPEKTEIAAGVAKPTTRRDRKGVSPVGPVWEAYADAYRHKYGEPPIRNAKVNSQLSAFCKRVPVAEGPEIARYYLTSRNARYVASGHSVGCLLQDAEKLRTEWATGRSGTAHAAREQDRQEGRGQGFRNLIARLEAEEAGRGTT